MQIGIDKKEIAKRLQAKINAMQGMEKLSDVPANPAFEPFASAFPGHVFPKGAIHEFISYEPADAASTNGFITALTGKFMKTGGLCLWIGNERKIYATGLKHFGIEPDRIVFIHVNKPKIALWIIEEALKCEALTAVIGEIRELGFTESRRLQLAVEQSGVTGFIHRYQPQSENAVACTTRWKITPLPSIIHDHLPGLGPACWDIQLLKVRNGRPNHWQISWSDAQFLPLDDKKFSIPSRPERYAG